MSQQPKLHTWFISSPDARLCRVDGITYFCPEPSDQPGDSSTIPVGGGLEIGLLRGSPDAMLTYENWDDQSRQLRAWSSPTVAVYRDSIEYLVKADMTPLNNDDDIDLELGIGI